MNELIDNSQFVSIACDTSWRFFPLSNWWRISTWWRRGGMKGRSKSILKRCRSCTKCNCIIPVDIISILKHTTHCISPCIDSWLHHVCNPINTIQWSTFISHTRIYFSNLIANFSASSLDSRGVWLKEKKKMGLFLWLEIFHL